MLRTLFWTFFRIAAVTPGGGLVMLPILQQEFEERQYRAKTSRPR